MLLRPSTDICPKDLTRDVRGFFNSLLAALALKLRRESFIVLLETSAAISGRNTYEQNTCHRLMPKPISQTYKCI